MVGVLPVFIRKIRILTHKIKRDKNILSICPQNHVIRALLRFCHCIFTASHLRTDQFCRKRIQIGIFRCIPVKSCIQVLKYSLHIQIDSPVYEPSFILQHHIVHQDCNLLIILQMKIFRCIRQLFRRRIFIIQNFSGQACAHSQDQQDNNHNRNHLRIPSPSPFSGTSLSFSRILRTFFLTFFLLLQFLSLFLFVSCHKRPPDSFIPSYHHTAGPVLFLPAFVASSVLYHSFPQKFCRKFSQNMNGTVHQKSAQYNVCRHYII